MRLDYISINTENASGGLVCPMVVPIVSGIYNSAEADSEFVRCGGGNNGRAVDRDGAGVGTIPPSRAGRVPDKHPDRRSRPPI